MPDWKSYVREHLPALGLSGPREREVVEELAQQLEQAYAEALAENLGLQQAAERAMAQFADWPALAVEIRRAEFPLKETIARHVPEHWKLAVTEQHVRTRWGGSMAADFVHDLRFAFRMLRKNRGFALFAIGMLAFGIGANSAIFTIVDTLALRPLPYHDPSGLLSIESREAHHAEQAPWISMLDLVDLRQRTQSFTAFAGISPVWNDVVTGQGDTERLETLYVSADFFPMLGVRPAIGRTFTANEDRLGAGARVVLLSYAYWQTHFGGDSSVLGRALDVNGVPFTIAGVLPRDFRYLGEPIAGTPGKIDLWFPLAVNQIAGTPRFVRFLKVIGRVKPGSSVQAREDLRSAGTTLAKQYPDTDAGLEWDAAPLGERISGRVRPMMLLLMGAVGLVLVMACANVANLLLTIAVSRGKEVAVRAALGASRWRLLRQFLAESFALAGLGTLAGIALAYALLRLLVSAAPASLLEGRTIALDSRAMLFTVAAAITCALLSGAPPAWRILRDDLANGLRETGRGFTGGHHRFRAGLVVAQISLALALLVGAALLTRSFVRLLDVNPGFDAACVATISTLLPSGVTHAPEALAMDRALLSQLAQVPGVQSAGAVSRLPLLGGNLGSWIWVQRHSYAPGEHTSVEYRVASPSYFATMGIPLRLGRIFDEHDSVNAGGVAVINDSAARAFWAGETPIGKRIKLGANPEKQDWITVIGVIGDVHQFGLDSQSSPEVYRPLAASPLFNPYLVVRTDGDAASLLPSLPAAVHGVSSAMPVYNSFSMAALIARSTAQRRFLLLLLAGFAASALFLAAAGIYGTISQSVAQRTQEMGLRMALGASRTNVLQMVLSQGLRLALAGVLLGAAGSALLTRFVRSLLFHVSPLDPAAFAIAAVSLLAVALLACAIPALRATRVDPLVALRHE
jgi:putative ABC transport system permease protein